MTGEEEPEDESAASSVTPMRRFRMEDRFWYPAMEKARSEGTTISAKIRGWIIAYVQGDHRDPGR